ncbi:MAG: type II secretion system F family protein [Lachnospiraceae bacterium]|nr:type II secretion system F family protein [Lachnospiraceae bacterium]
MGTWQEEEILWILHAMPWCAAVLTVILTATLASGGADRLVLRTCDEFAGLLREKGRQSTWYRRQEQWLKRKGASFHFGGWVNPAGFLALRGLAGLLGFAVGSCVSAGYGILGGVLLYMLPTVLVEYLDKKDNERMLSEIKLVYHTLAMQIRAGIHVTDALAECYAGVREPRLYQAFLDLAGAIAMKGDVFRALEELQSGMDNRYIDSLCITVLQALESGQAVELLNDIGEQIRDMEGTMLERRKNRLDRSLTFYQLGILAAVLCVALYACVTYLFGQAVTF